MAKDNRELLEGRRLGLTETLLLAQAYTLIDQALQHAHDVPVGFYVQLDMLKTSLKEPVYKALLAYDALETLASYGDVVQGLRLEPLIEAATTMLIGPYAD